MPIFANNDIEIAVSKLILHFVWVRYCEVLRHDGLMVPVCLSLTNSRIMRVFQELCGYGKKGSYGIKTDIWIKTMGKHPPVEIVLWF